MSAITSAIEDKAIDSDKSEERFYYLDSMRGIAALSVVFSHYVSAYGIQSHGNFWYHSPAKILFDGAAAVALFFILSGFVLSFKYLHSESNIDYPGYIVSRICRIWLPFLCILSLSVLVQMAFFSESTRTLWQSDWITEFWKNGTDLNGFINQALFESTELMPQAWTLKIEIELSLLIPVAIAMLKRSYLLTIASAIYAIYVLHISYFVLFFLTGMLIAKHYYDIRKILGSNDKAIVSLFITAIFLYTSRDTLPHFLKFGISIPAQYIIAGIASAMVMMSAISSMRVQRFLMNPAIHFIGHISYSVYLSHMIILISITPKIIELTHSWIIGLISTLSLTLILSYFLYRFVELPSIELGKKIRSSML